MTTDDLIQKQKQSVNFWKGDLLKSLYELQQKLETEIKSIETDCQPNLHSLSINLQEIIWKSVQLDINKNFLSKLKQEVTTQNDAQNLAEQMNAEGLASGDDTWDS